MQRTVPTGGTLVRRGALLLTLATSAASAGRAQPVPALVASAGADLSQSWAGPCTQQPPMHSSVLAERTASCADNGIGSSSGSAFVVPGLIRLQTFTRIAANPFPPIGNGMITTMGANGEYNDYLFFSETEPTLPGGPPVTDIPVSFTIRLSGTMFASAPSGSAATSGLDATFTLASKTVAQRTFFEGCNVPNDPCDPPQSILLDIKTAAVRVPLHVPVGMSWYLAAGSGAQGPGALSYSDFSHTIEFPVGVDVFDLPVGYTVNAGTWLVNNRYVPVVTAAPEPATLGLVAIGLAGLARRVRRRSRR